MYPVKFYSRNGELVNVLTDAEETCFDDELFASTADPGVSKSPCKCRPDTWRPCELLSSPKDNDICYQCGLRRGLPPTGDTSEDRKALALRLAGVQEEPEVAETPSEFEFLDIESETVSDAKCVFPGCLMTACCRDNTLCIPHDMVVRTRESRGKTGADLFAPVRKRRNLK
jgi:hypothetical protein